MASLTGPAKQRYVADLFSRIYRRYDLMNDLITFRMHRGWKRLTAAVATQGVTGAALDVSTGTGDLAFELGKSQGIDRVAGIDLLPEMIAKARSKLAGKPLESPVHLLVGDALSLPFPDGAFACATSGFSLRNMPDLQAALEEMARVIRPGGRLALLELTPMQRGAKSVLFRPYFHGLVPIIGQLVAGNRSAYTYLPQSVDYFPEAHLLAALLTRLGLAGVGYRRLGFGTISLHWAHKPAG